MSWKSPTYRELEKLAARYPPLSPEAQERLAAIASTGDPQAQELLYLHNTTRLLYFARCFAPDGPGWQACLPPDRRLRNLLKWKDYAPKTLTVDDILSAAQLGLWKAIRTYDPTRGRFNHHANVLIWQEIQSLREREEQALGDAAQEPKTHEENAPTLNALQADFEKEVALILLERYAQKALGAEADRFMAMVRGEEKPDFPFLRQAGEKLRQVVPKADWEFLASALLGA